MKEKVLLGNLLVAEFASSGMSDAAFAVYATEKLQCPVNTSHVTHIRKAFSMEPNSAANEAKGEFKGRVEALEKKIAALEKRIDVYFSTGKVPA